jgi:hypothetical protein
MFDPADVRFVGAAAVVLTSDCFVNLGKEAVGVRAEKLDRKMLLDQTFPPPVAA